MSEEKNESRSPIPVSPGFAIIGLLTTGVVGIIIGIGTGSGIPLLASTGAFGLVAWIAFR